LGGVSLLRGAAGEGVLGAGRRWELEVVELSDLPWIVDQTEELTRTARGELGDC
jgi:hypothetical protein